MYGLPCRVEAIQQVVNCARKKRNRPLHLIFDAAHAFGAALNGRRVRGFGDAEIFSLSVTKALVAVEGGLVSSRDENLIRRIKKMRNYGIEENYDTHWPGLNGKMSEFHAIVGLENLKRLNKILAIRKKNAAHFGKEIEEKTSFRTVPLPTQVTHTFKDFTIVVPPKLKARRDAVIRFLKENGVETRAYFYPPVHEQTFFKRFSDRSLPVTEDLSRRVITLPFYTSITEEEMNYMVEILVEAERSV